MLFANNRLDSKEAAHFEFGAQWFFHENESQLRAPQFWCKSKLSYGEIDKLTIAPMALATKKV